MNIASSDVEDSAHNVIPDLIGKVYDIVVVDDDAFVFEVFKRMLRKTSYRIACFECPDKALIFLQSNHTRTMVVDYRMPRLDGISFISQLNKNPMIERTNIYISSAAQLPDQVESDALKLGALSLLKDQFTEPGFLENLCDQNH